MKINWGPSGGADIPKEAATVCTNGLNKKEYKVIKIVDFSELQRGLQEFKRGMLGLLKLLMYEAMQSQRLDHYAMYKTMWDITDEWVSVTASATAETGDLNELLSEDAGGEEAIARMILNFPKDANTDYA